VRRFLIIAAILTIAFGLFLVNCSDDATNPDLTQTQVSSIEAQTTMMVGMMGASFGAGFEYVEDGVSDGLAKPADTSYYNDCWWVEQDSSTYEDTILLITMTDSHIDSFSFIIGDTCQMIPDSTTTGLLIITSGLFSIDNGADTSFTMTADINSEFDGFTDVNTVINGETDFLIDSQQGNEQVSFHYNGDYEDITLVNADIESGDAHPISGTVAMTLDFEDSSQDESFHITINLTFSSSGYHGSMTYEGDTFVWDVTWEQVDASVPFLGKRFR